MRHKHHIIPKHMGGLDNEENLVSLSVEEHAEEHRKLFEQFGKHEDFVAWKALSGYMTKEEIIQELCSLGGKKQGKINAENGHMKNVQPLGSSLGGKRGSKTCREQMKNAFFDPELRKNITVLGGKKQGKINAENGHMKNISTLSKKNTGMFWITNGIENKMLKKGEIIEDGWRKGATQKRKI